MDMITILEVDQWTSTGNLRQIPWDELTSKGIDAISGGDSAAAKAIFGGRFWLREVSPSARPSIGSVWFVRGDDGFPQFYLANYDSSD